MNTLRVVGSLDANFGWSDGSLVDASRCTPAGPTPGALRGAFACVTSEPGARHRIVRDPLGINKLFWSATDDGAILVASRPRRLIDVGSRFETIQAIPAGTAIDLDLSVGSSGSAMLNIEGVVRREAENQPSIECLAAQIRSTLDAYLDALAEAHAGRKVFVCLSGGLDSSGIAILARDHFPDVVAVSFDLERPDSHSDDRRTAERLARDLGMPLLCVTVTDQQLLAAIDVVLVEGIDWRDFNVHAALVNAALAAGIASAVPGPAMVLTGDFPNEYLVDYHAEKYGGREYYRLPRLTPDALRATLIKGLETSHREGGPFQAWGLPVVQPYAVVVDHYIAIPPSFLAIADRKERLSRMIFGDRIPEYVYSRPKTRAQVGGAGGGVLAACIDHGIDGAWLRRRFAELHAVTEMSALDRFIRGGRYRAAIPFATEQPYDLRCNN